MSYKGLKPATEMYEEVTGKLKKGERYIIAKNLRIYQVPGNTRFYGVIKGSLLDVFLARWLGRKSIKELEEL